MSDATWNNAHATPGRTKLAAVFALALALFVQLPSAAIADAKRLDCNLTRLQTKTGTDFDVATEAKSVTITFDEQAGTLVVDRDGMAHFLDHVTMTPIAMTGYVDDLSLGIDRSSWSIVLQTYKANSVSSEFGICGQSARSAP